MDCEGYFWGPGDVSSSWESGGDWGMHLDHVQDSEDPYLETFSWRWPVVSSGGFDTVEPWYETRRISRRPIRTEYYERTYPLPGERYAPLSNEYVNWFYVPDEKWVFSLLPREQRTRQGGSTRQEVITPTGVEHQWVPTYFNWKAERLL